MKTYYNKKNWIKIMFNNNNYSYKYLNKKIWNKNEKKDTNNKIKYWKDHIFSKLSDEIKVLHILPNLFLNLSNSFKIMVHLIITNKIYIKIMYKKK
jgi:hypothetical protein